ncbi:MAG: hypothetical protein ACI4TZ_00190 [Christensenellales bacterium]
MSFFTSNRTDRCPGPIVGNPLNGLCEKACIVTKKVFDSCINQFQAQNVDVAVTDFTPANPTLPLTFVGCSSTGEMATISNLSITRFDDRPNFARVTVDVNIPININYTDANGVPGVATGTMTVSEDVVMCVPQASVIPFTVEAFGSAICSDGEYIGENTFRITACVTVILRVVVEAELLVPSYGYCQIPPCQEFNTDVCEGAFNLPLYPTTR